MMSSKALGLGSALRKSILTPRIGRTQPALKTWVQKRGIQVESMPAADSDGILNKQRLVRPSSPHFTIYQPQLTWISSIANRVTGTGLSVLLYGYLLAYLAGPGTFDSTHIIEFIGSLPEAVKYAGKTILAIPFAFHSINGIRHLSWDMGKFLSLKNSYRAGYAVLGASGLASIALILM